MLAKIWQYRQFIYSSVKRDFQSRYTGSVLGGSWMVFQPLAMILVYTLVFSNVMHSKLAGMDDNVYAYSIYLCAGALPWNVFNEIVMNIINVFQGNANLLKKVSFPRICLPVISTFTGILNFAIGFSLFLLFLLLAGSFPFHAFWAFFVVFFVQLVFSLSISVGLGVMNVFFRDIGQMMGIVLQFWFWFTPIVYPVKIVPGGLSWLLKFNPMYYLVAGYHDIFLYDQLPNFMSLVSVLAVSFVFGFWSLHIYRKHVGEMVDEL